MRRLPQLRLRQPRKAGRHRWKDLQQFAVVRLDAMGVHLPDGGSGQASNGQDRRGIVCTVLQPVHGRPEPKARGVTLEHDHG